MADELAVRASGLRKSYGGLPVLDGLDLGVARGSVFALLGPNGAGKTTTVKILSTLVSADGGTAAVAGYDIRRQRHLVRRSISVTGQDVALDELQTGVENLFMMGRLSGLPRPRAAQRAAELLELFDLTGAGQRRVATYSGGMRRKLDLAVGLVGRPAVVFLDEPTTGLDPRSRQAVWQIVRQLTGDGVTVFLTTQYLEEADQLADRIVVMDAGRVVADGSAASLKRQYADQRLDLTMADPAGFAAVREQFGEAIVHSDQSRLVLGVATDGSAADIRRLLDAADPQRRAVTRFEVHTATLDDVFLALTGHSASAKEPAHV
jgi:ABC-2 type transport system ATP-binding protein